MVTETTQKSSPHFEEFDDLCCIEDHEEMRGLQSATSAFEAGHDAEDCPEILSCAHSPLSLAKDTAAAGTTDNTPAAVKQQPDLPQQQMRLNTMKNIFKDITFGIFHESNHGSAPQLKKNVHQKYKSINDIDSSDEDIPSERTRKQKKSIAKISGGSSSTFNGK